MGHPPVLGEPTLVVADSVQDHRERSIGDCGHPVIEDSDEGLSIRVWAELPDDLPRGVIQRPKDSDRAILPSRWTLHRTPSSLPDLCQPGMAVDFALIQGEEAKSAGGVRALFRGQASTCSATATAF